MQSLKKGFGANRWAVRQTQLARRQQAGADWFQEPTGTLAGKQLINRLFFRIGDEAASGERCVLARRLSEKLPMNDRGREQILGGSGYAMARRPGARCGTHSAKLTARSIADCRYFCCGAKIPNGNEMCHAHRLIVSPRCLYSRARAYVLVRGGRRQVPLILPSARLACRSPPALRSLMSLPGFLRLSGWSGWTSASWAESWETCLAWE